MRANVEAPAKRGTSRPSVGPMGALPGLLPSAIETAPLQSHGQPHRQAHRQARVLVTPPVGWSTWPANAVAPGPARKDTAAALACLVARRPTGTSSRIPLRIPP